MTILEQEPALRPALDGQVAATQAWFDSPRFAGITRLYSARQVVELLLVIGQYVSIARLVASTGIEPDPPVTPSGLSRSIDPQE